VPLGTVGFFFGLVLVIAHDINIYQYPSKQKLGIITVKYHMNAVM